MFFSDRIKGIKKNDRVLEIGPGGTPHARADVFLDLDPKLFKDDEEASYQRGQAPPLKTSKPIVYYDGKVFPFKTGEFDYVICSHVLEHVEDVEQFLSELFRITKRGYIEFPTILYDYLYDIPVHYNFLLFNERKNSLSWLKKTDTSFADFSKVQAFFRESLILGHDSLIKNLEESMIQGFEWSKPFDIKKARSLVSLVPSQKEIQAPKPEKAHVELPVPQLVYKPLNEYSLNELLDEASRKARRKARKYLKRGKPQTGSDIEAITNANVRSELDYFLSIRPEGRPNTYSDNSISAEERLFEKMLWWLTNSSKNFDGVVNYWVDKHANEDVGTHNLSNREAWLEKTLGNIPKGTKILDAGAGELQYKRFCKHLDYVSQDFAQYDGTGDNKGLQTSSWDNTKLDIISDITDIPVKDMSFEAIMCIEVFEHIPKPVDALREFSRIMKKGGKLVITTPVSSLTHFAPYYFYNGYSRYFFESLLPEFGFKLEELSLSGNYFEYLAQEVRRIDGVADDYAKGGKKGPLDTVVRELLLARLQDLSKKGPGSSELLSHGVHVVAVKV